MSTLKINSQRDTTLFLGYRTDRNLYHPIPYQETCFRNLLLVYLVANQDLYRIDRKLRIVESIFWFLDLLETILELLFRFS